MNLSLIIPAYNEERRLGATLENYARWMEGKFPGDAELIVVANGSSDQTAAVAREMASAHPCIRVLEDRRRIGKGGAILMGMDAAQGDRIGFVDADGATPPEAFQMLVEGLGGAGLCMANRWRPDSRISPPQPFLRRAASRVFNGLVRLLFGFRTTDTQCGAKLWSRQAQAAVRSKIGITRWAFDVDLLFQIKRAGLELVDVPTIWRDQAGSHVQLGKSSWEMVLAVGRLRLLYSSLRWIVFLYDGSLGRWIHRTDRD